MSLDDINLDDLLRKAISLGASDLHLSSGHPAVVRINGDLHYLDQSTLHKDHIEQLLGAHLTGKRDVVSENEQGRFRVNIYRQRKGLSAAIRILRNSIPTLSALDCPQKFEQLMNLKNGLILVTGPTGSGKSTTLAAMIDHINQTRPVHIITLEDPIEYLHESRQSLINQCEVHVHTESFAAALRAALREDPDVIMIGEMRDLETMRLALTAAETGHLVLSTLHTSSAAQTIHRIIDCFLAGEKDQVRAMLSESLQAVIAQQLVPAVSGGRIAAWELMLGTVAIRNLIRNSKTEQLQGVIETGRQDGMQTICQSLQDLYRAGKIAQTTYEEQRSVGSQNE